MTNHKEHVSSNCHCEDAPQSADEAISQWSIDCFGKKTGISRLAMTFVALVIICSFLGCSKFKPIHAKRQYFRIDTFTEITIVQDRAMDLEPVWRSIDSLMLDWEERFSQSHHRSEVLQLNLRTQNQVNVSPVLAEITATGLRYGDSLDGMFDISIYPVKKLWNLDEQDSEKRVPPGDSVALMAGRVDYRKIRLDKAGNGLVFDSPETEVDVGGIAKGFVIREIGKLLEQRGFKNYLIVAGGDILCGGKRHDGRAWIIGIQHPRTLKELMAVVNLDSGAVVTSGDYQRFWIKDGTRIHHIFDPRTGYSCTKNRSVTLWGMDPVEVDILATGLFCLSRDSILSYVEERPRFECVVVDSAGEIAVSEGWKDKVRFRM
jgi:thiamine biosynthesis lipoprotein